MKVKGKDPTLKRFSIDQPQGFHWDIVLCLALSLIAIVLRAGPLGPWSLWRDDAWQALAARAGTWAQAARIGQTAPGFSVLLSFWLMLTGFSSLAAQALPFVAGVAGAPFAYLLAKRCGRGRATLPELKRTPPTPSTRRLTSGHRRRSD